VRYVAAFGRFWWSFVIGDDWRIAASVAAVLGLGAVLVAVDVATDHVLTVLIGGLLVVLAMACIVLPARAARGARQPGGGGTRT
jgi:hypothetical protein